MIKPVYEWDWEYIQSLRAGEYDWLEVKGLGAAPGQAPVMEESKIRDMLARELTALANSGGGKLIWGLKDPEGRQWVVENGGVPVNFKRGTNEWLKNVISELADPPLKGYNVYTITEADGLDEGKALFVIDVPDSTLAPHQNARNRVYYGRLSGNCQPLNHRFLMDILGRRQNPKLAFYYRTSAEINQLAHIPGNRGKFTIYLDIGIKNDGRVTARFPALEIPNPSSRARFAFQDKRKGANQHTGYGLPRRVPGRNDTSVIYMGGADDVVFPGQTIEIARYELDIDGLDAVQTGKINFPYKIYADGFQIEDSVELPLEDILREARVVFDPDAV